MPGLKKTNEYQRFFPNYEKTPKAVIAAIALSLAMRLNEDNLALSRDEIRNEWKILHKNEIVPQKPK